MQVNHIIIGAGRSGTTSLVEYLKQHPSVAFSSIKEVSYFSVDEHFQRGEQYLHEFFVPNDQPVVATSDTYLLMAKQAPKRIAEYNPNMKLTVILREPGERSHSNFHFSKNNGHISANTDFVACAKDEKECLEQATIIEQNNRCHFYGSLYHLHLTNWLKHFDRSQLFICTTTELKNDPQGLLNRYFEFLGLSPLQLTSLEAKNSAAGVKSKSLNRFLVNRDHWLRRLLRGPLKSGPLRRAVLNSNVVEKVKASNQQQLVYPPMSASERAFCDDYFKEDLRKLNEDFQVSF